MSWKRATFKGKEVWAEVGPGGQLVASGGRVPIRYSDREGARIYRAGASRLTLGDGAPVELPDGVSADAAGPSRSKRGSGFGKAGTRTAQQAAMAAGAARQLLESLPEDAVRVFTDGACRGNPGPAGSGAVVALPDERVLEGWLSIGRGTNNQGELRAIGLALDLLDEAEVAPDATVALMTDSSYSHGVLCRGWKAKANGEVIAALRERLALRPGLTIHWVAGHVGIEGNERADRLAVLGADGDSGKAWVQ